MPRAARATTAERSSATSIHRLMPSDAAAAHAGRHRGRGDEVASAGVLRPGAGPSRRAVPGSRSSSSSSAWSRRLDQPGPQQPPVGHRGDDVTGTADRSQAQVRTVALGERTDVHRALGQPRPQADQRRRRRCRWRGRPRRPASRCPIAAQPVRRPAPRSARCRPGSALAAGGRWRPPVRRRAPTRNPSMSGPNRSTSTPTISHPSCSSRSSSGGNDGCSTTTRSPRWSTSRATRSRASMAPSTTVIASGGERPRGRQLLLQRRQHRVVEIARREGLLGDPGERRPEVGQQVGIRRAR